MSEDKNTQHIISFSGGKDSTAMLFLMLEKGMRIDRIISVDTYQRVPCNVLVKDKQCILNL